MKKQFQSNFKRSCSVKQDGQKRIQFLKGISMVCLLFLSMSTLQAQDIKKDTQTTQAEASIEKNILVQGNVSDEFGPLPDVNISLEGTRIGTATDDNGDFQFPQKLKKGDVLVFSHIGLKSQKIVISDANSASKIELKIDMMMDDIIIVGKVASKKVYKSSRD